MILEQLNPTRSVYKKATMFQLIFSQFNTAASMLFFSLAGLMSYLANEGYGITVSVTGIILTATRICDGFIDPILAIFIDRINTRFGKIRLILIIGWCFRSFATFLLFVWGSQHDYGILYFISMYIIYIIGATLSDISGNMIAPVITNDPVQRPYVQVWSTLYSFLIPIAFSLITTLVILPKYGNYYSAQMLRETALLAIPISLVLTIICILSIAAIDRPENFAGFSVSEEKRLVGFADMLRLFRRNRPFLMYLVSSVMTKLSQHIATQAILTTMFFGILIGDLQLGIILNSLSMIPALGFGFVGAKYSSKFGNKATTITWTKLNMLVSFVTILFLTSIDMKMIPSNKLYMLLFFLLLFFANGTKMCVTIANGAMRSDIIDYELVSSGKFIPAMITSTYNFIDQIISSLGTSIAAFSAAFIGYKIVVPQPTDAATIGIKAIALFLLFGFPILTGGIGLLAMKHYSLTFDKMADIQKEIFTKRQEQ